MIESATQIEWTPAGGAAVTLCEAGGWLAAAPVIEAAQDVAEESGMLLAKRHFFPTGNARLTITIEITTTHAGLETLGVFLAPDTWGAPAALSSARGTLTFTCGDQVATYAAALQSITPRLPLWPEAEVTRSFQFTAAPPTLNTPD
jgi:hypothetical protein